MRTQLLSNCSCFAFAAMLAINCFASSANAITIADFQSNLPAGHTYYDLTLDNAPLASTWGFPDGSDSDFTIDGNVADDKGRDAEEMEMTISGLSPSTQYAIDVVLFGKAGGEDGFGVAAGFTSGALTNYLASDGSDATPGGATSSGGNYRIPIGLTFSDGAGDLSVFLGNDDPNNSPRTEIDGVIVSPVPEPGTLALLTLGTLGLFAFGYRRR